MAGRLNRRITLRSVTVSNVLGELTETFADAGERWAERRSLSARESFVAEQRYASSDWVFVFRSDSLTRTITPEWQLVDGTETFDIQAAFDPDGRKREVHVIAKLSE